VLESVSPVAEPLRKRGHAAVYRTATRFRLTSPCCRRPPTPRVFFSLGRVDFEWLRTNFLGASELSAPCGHDSPLRLILR
jgi:hypothetical protein